MRALTSLLLRFATGLYLLAWSVVKLQSTERAIEISDKLYLGQLSTPVIQHGLGALGGVLGLFVVLGFFRRFSYSVQALVLAAGVAALVRTTAIPADLAAGIDAATALLPYAALVLAALAPLVWKKDDVVSLDSLLAWAEGRLAKDEGAGVAAPAIVAASVAAAHEEAPAHREEMPAAPAAEAHAPATEEVHGAAPATAATQEEPAAPADEPAPSEHAHAEEAHAHDGPMLGEAHKHETHAGSAAVH